MEKNATERTIVKGEPLAANKAITVDVDPEALNCPKCLRPLSPWVFACAAGHLVCSSCHDKLPDKTRCGSCFINTGYSRSFIPTSYSRCHGIERILGSVRIPCPNAIHGCTAGKMLYHQATEHEKACSSTTAGFSGVARRIVKMGPCGGGGGDAREMDAQRVNRIHKVIIWHGAMVDSMLVFFELDEDKILIDKWGCSPAGDPSEICLEEDEFLISMKGNVGNCKGWLRLSSLSFVSNRRTFGPYGTGEGAPFELPAAGGKIVGFHGRSGTFLDALGTYVKI